ncbi:MAG: glycosyltransferase family 39 protein [Candidatus Aenigmarchaeota archaeon]|nr:glycosyltransferase family 39 protein [Candidatus Aenigmarchaeota archaeon]
MLELVYSFLDQNILAFMSIHLAFLLAFLALNFKTIAKQFSKIDRKIWIILLVIFLVGFCLRNAEYWYGEHADAYAPLETAKFLVLEGKHVKACSAGRAGYCSSYQQVLQPVGFPFITSLFYIIFGINTLPVLVFSAVLGSLSIILVFLTCYLLFKKEEIGLYAALVYALIPLDIFFSGTGFTRIISVFFIGFTVLVYLIALRKNDLSLWVLFSLFLSLSIYIRQENYILIPLFFLGLFLFKYNIKNKDNIKKLLISAAIFMIFQLHVFYWTFFMIAHALGNPPGLPTYSLICLEKMSPYILDFLWGFSNYPVSNPYSFAATVLFIIGIAFIPLSFSLKERHLSKPIFVTLWFILFFLVYGSYCMNFIDGFAYGPDGSFIRYIIQFHIPYSILAGYGFYMITKAGKRISKYTVIVFIPIFIILLLLPVQSPTSLFKDARTDYDSEYFSAIKNTPPNSTVIAQMFMLVSSDVVGGNRKYIDPEVMILHGTAMHTIELLHESEDVYYIELHYCNDWPDHHGCRFIRDNLDLEFAFSEGSLNVFKVIVGPDKDYAIEWDNLLHEIEVRSNKIVNMCLKELI